MCRWRGFARQAFNGPLNCEDATGAYLIYTITQSTSPFRCLLQSLRTWLGMTRYLAWILLFASSTSIVRAQPAHLRTIAAAGELAPGFSTPATFASFLGDARINDDGEVVFRSDTSGGSGVWVDRGAGLEPIALAGSQATGASGDVRFGQLNDPQINREGKVLFQAYLQGDDVTPFTESSLWIHDSGSLSQLVRQGDLAPASPSPPFPSGGPTYFSPNRNQVSLATGELVPAVSEFGGSRLFNAVGQTAFTAELSQLIQGDSTDSPLTSSIWLTRNDAPQEVIRTGITPSGGLGPFLSEDPSIWRVAKLNNQGDLVLAPRPNSALAGSLWLSRHNGSAHDLQPILSAGQLAGPELPGLAISSANLEGFNDATKILVSAHLEGPGVTIMNDEALLLSTPTGIKVLAREGDAIDGSSLTFGQVQGMFHRASFERGALSANGKAVFTALTSTGVALLTADSEGVRIVAETGMQAPNAAPGNVFPKNSGLWHDPAINDYGQVAFMASVSDLTGQNGYERGMWVTDRSGVLRNVFLDYQQLEVRPGDVRNLGFATGHLAAGSEEGISTGLNRKGEVAFFSDIGVFVSTIGTLPEPSATALLAIGSILLTFCRRCIC